MSYPNRTMCDILEEMRKSLETLNLGYMAGLIEEVQSTANKMEAGLYDIKDRERLLKQIKKLRKQKNELEEELGVEDEHF